MARRQPSEGGPARLLILTPDFPPARGGIQVVAQRLASGLQGMQTRLLTLDSPGAGEYDEAAGLDVRRIGAGALPRSARNLLLNAAALGDALRFRPQAVLSLHIVASPAAWAIRRALGARTIQYFYGDEIGAKPKLAAFAARRADAAIAISAYTAELIAATGAVRANTRLIAPGVDIPGETTPLRAERPTVLTISRLDERYKGHDVMLRAFSLVLSKVPDAQWVVIGDGSLRPGLEQLARSYRVDRAVSFLGAVDDEQRDAWLRRADIFAMPSRLPAGGFAGEGFGIVYLEAGAFAKPVVAGNVGGALDAVLYGETGLLVDPLYPRAVAEAVTCLLQDGALARRLGEAGQARAQLYAWPKVVERVQALLLEQLHEAGGRAGARGAPGAGRTAA
jgi:phosphatidylinositol alpha-1,6-mannosyltransferase